MHSLEVLIYGASLIVFRLSIGCHSTSRILQNMPITSNKHQTNAGYFILQVNHLIALGVREVLHCSAQKRASSNERWSLHFKLCTPTRYTSLRLAHPLCSFRLNPADGNLRSPQPQARSLKCNSFNEL